MVGEGRGRSANNPLVIATGLQVFSWMTIPLKLLVLVFVY